MWFSRRRPPLFPTRGGAMERNGAGEHTYRYTAPPARPQAVPFLPLLAAICLLLAGVQVYAWWAQTTAMPLEALWNRLTHGVSLQPAWMQEKPPSRRTTPQVMERAYTAEPWPQEPVRLALTLRPGDVVLGDPAGRPTVTLFTNPACGACRVAMQDKIARLTQPHVRVVVRFWPTAGEQTPTPTGGLVMALAHAGGVQSRFWKALMAAKGNLTESDLLTLLDQSGLSFEKQRALLTARPDLGHTADRSLSEALRPYTGALVVMAVNGVIEKE